MNDPIDLDALRGPWLPTDSDMPEYLSAAKRVNLRKSAWLSSWWVGHGKDESCQIEGPPNHWFWLAYILLGLVDQKDAPYSDDAPLPFSPAYLRAALAELTTSRARDAEVAELVAKWREDADSAEQEAELTDTGSASYTAMLDERAAVLRECATDLAALLPFQRSDDKGDAT